MRYFTSIFLLFCMNYIALSQSVCVQVQDSGVLFKEGEDSILFYQSANKEMNGKFKRSNYIHPLYTLDGEILTEDFPSDHPHHRGIFWAWHQLYVGDKRIGDGWETKDFHWQVISVEKLNTKGKQRSIKVNVIWKSPLFLDSKGNEKPLVSEWATITAHPKEQNYRQIDIEISLVAKEPNVRIGGSEDEKGYGGFSSRIRLVEDILFTGPMGPVTPRNFPLKGGAWIDMVGSIGHEGALAGFTILSHPNNPGYPNPWILRSKKSMQNAVYPYPGAKAVVLSDLEPTVLRYSILVHNGLKASEISSLHTQYGKKR